MRIDGLRQDSKTKSSEVEGTNKNAERKAIILIFFKSILLSGEEKRADL